jgi:hypothetical protein
MCGGYVCELYTLYIPIIWNYYLSTYFLFLVDYLSLFLCKRYRAFPVSSLKSSISPYVCSGYITMLCEEVNTFGLDDMLYTDPTGVGWVDVGLAVSMVRNNPQEQEIHASLVYNWYH